MPLRNKGFCLCLLALTLPICAVAENPIGAIADCARISSTGDRILCLENALRRLSPNEADTTPAAAAPANESREISVAEPEEAEPRIGDEQVRARNATREQRLSSLESAAELKVARYSKVPYERLVVELDNGQIWRQIKGDVQRIRVNLDRNQTVNITQSALGGYQLRLNEIRRTIRVERIR